LRIPPPPLANSYWVERGRLLAGEHPCSGDEKSWQRRLQLLGAAGVRTFIDLTQEGEMPDYRHLLPPDAHAHRLPIPDHSVPENAARMRQIQRQLALSLSAEGAVYVHCRAGFGRTGTAMGCYLRERGHSPEQALTELNRLWQENARAAFWPTVPETQAQQRYILDWIVEAARATA
jgi:protein-tyrosine phosphatase